MEGNNMKMRDALIEIENMAHCDLGNVYPKYRNKFDNLVGGIERIAHNALSAPARQCDMGTDEEQVDRYCRHCQTHCISCEHRRACNVCGERYRLRCFARWAQMPYEA